MLQPAQAFLFHEVPDPIVVQYNQLYELPAPAYIAELRDALCRKGIKYLHVDFWPEWRQVPTGSESWRVYRVKSFVWREQLYIIRARFAKGDFERWSEELRALWQETTVKVPDETARLP